MAEKEYTFPLLGHKRLRRHRDSLCNEIYFLTFRKYPTAKNLDEPSCFQVIDSLLAKMEAEHMLHWFAFVLMPDHMHLVLRLGDKPLHQILQRIKGTSAREINQSRGGSGKLWAPGYYDHTLRKKEPLGASVYYVMMNPVRKGLVQNHSDWPFAKARWNEATDFQV